MSKDELDTQRIGQRLREVRKTLNMTIDDAHRETGFSRSLISEVENGLKKPSSLYLFALLDKFNVNINYIFKGKGSMFTDPISCAKEFGPDQENIEILLDAMKHVDLVRYSVLKFFIEFKTANREYIENALSEKN
jgi:transcriptional regulator with XRE-family HTH domain